MTRHNDDRGHAADLDRAIVTLARTDRLLLALDFDGTLAPLVDAPDKARALPEARSALQLLEHLDHTWVAYVSGRSVESLAHVAQADPDSLLIGSHGAEERLGRSSTSLRVTSHESKLLVQLRSELAERVGYIDGIRLETKPLGFAVHYRGASSDSVDRALEALRGVEKNWTHATTTRRGKDVVEFSIRTVTKGDAVERLRIFTGATGVFFAGDDLTDEDGFGALMTGDVGVKVGASPTLASYSVADEHSLAGVLARIGEARQEHLSTRL